MQYRNYQDFFAKFNRDVKTLEADISIRRLPYSIVLCSYMELFSGKKERKFIYTPIHIIENINRKTSQVSDKMTNINTFSVQNIIVARFVNL